MFIDNLVMKQKVEVLFKHSALGMVLQENILVLET